MPSTIRSAIAPCYLLACLILGGSVQGIWQNAVLQLGGLALIAWAAVEPADEPMPKRAIALIWLLIAAIAVVALQAVPLPPSLWAHGARARIAEGFQLLGAPLPSLPISLTPYVSLTALLSLIPPVALFCAIVRLKAYRPSWLAVSLLLGTLLGIVLGALQVMSGDSDASWYLYPQTNRGVGVGFFANANHMASLLVFSLPFAAAIAAAGKSRNLQRYSALLTIVAAVTIVIVIGIALNGSLAGFALAVPVLAASLLMLVPADSRWRSGLILVGAVSVLAAVGALGSTGTSSKAFGADASSSVQSRTQILAVTGRAIRDFMPWGSGLGSFPSVYRLYESPVSVTEEYVIHAHDDYVEIALELGVAGVILILAFLAWWVACVREVWRSGKGTPFARAASVASAAILVHSLVDFPLRTAAIAASFAMAIALLIERPARRAKGPDDLRPTRHLTIA